MNAPGTVPASLLALQRLAGNRATSALIQRDNEESAEHATAGEQVRSTLRAAGNRVVSQPVQRDPTYVDALSDPLPGGRSTQPADGAKDTTVQPQHRDALLAAARGSIEQGLKQLPSCCTSAAQLLGVLQSPAPGGLPGLAPQAMAVAAVLVGKLQMTGAQLDAGLQMYEKAGGRLADIPAVLKVRGYVSSALFFARQLMAGDPSAAQQVFTLAQATMPALTQYRAGEAAQLASPKQGPATAADVAKAAGESSALRARYLGALGAAPTM